MYRPREGYVKAITCRRRKGNTKAADYLLQLAIMSHLKKGDAKSPEENLAGNDYNVLAKKRDAEAVDENPTGICFLSNQVSNLFYQLD